MLKEQDAHVYNPKGLRKIRADEKIPTITYYSSIEDEGIIMECRDPEE